MANLMSMAKGRFNTKRNKSKPRTMAKKKGRKSKSRKSNGSASGVFSGKILGFKIPLIGDALKNKTVQKAIAGAGIVSLAVTAASLINNPMINRGINNKLIRLGLAGAAGDITGIATEFVKEGGVGQLRNIANGGGRGNGATQQSLVPMSGGGVA